MWHHREEQKTVGQVAATHHSGEQDYGCRFLVEAAALFRLLYYCVVLLLYDILLVASTFKIILLIHLLVNLLRCLNQFL